MLAKNVYDVWVEVEELFVTASFSQFYLINLFFSFFKIIQTLQMGRKPINKATTKWRLFQKDPWLKMTICYNHYQTSHYINLVKERLTQACQFGDEKKRVKITRNCNLCHSSFQLGTEIPVISKTAFLYFQKYLESIYTLFLTTCKRSHDDVLTGP